MPPWQAVQTQPDSASEEIFDQLGIPVEEKLSLLEMTRIMDVAATLRKERSIVEQQLNIDQIKAKLRERLLEAARVAGDPVTPQEVDVAIEQYYDRLHEFQEPKPSWRTFLAHLWVRRGPIIAGLIALGALLATCWGLLAAGILPGEARDRRIAVQQQAALDDAFQSFQQAAAALEQLSDDPGVALEVNALRASASAAQNQQDDEKLAELTIAARELQATLEASYRVVIASGANEQSAVERQWTDEEGTRTSGFYVIVEAKDANDRPVPVSIHNRETNRTERVSKWAEQVPEEVFNRLAADKQADGVLDESLYGEKVRGERELGVRLEGVDGQPLPRMGQITSWQ